MRPTSLAVRGLKCWEDKTIEFGQFTAIQGPNGSGKTAIIQGLRLALLGYDPDTGKQLDKTRTLISPGAVKETADIGLSFDNSFGIRRRFGAKSELQVLPPRGESTIAKCQERIDKETGGLVVSLDLATFFDLSDEKRRAWLFEHLPNDGTVLEWKTYAKWIDDEGALGDVVKNLWENNVQTAPNAVVGLGSAIEAAHREFLEVDKGRHAQGEVVDRGVELLRTDKAPEPIEEGALADAEERLASTNQRIGEARAGREAREAIEARISDSDDKRSTIHGEMEHVEHVRKDLAAQLAGMKERETRDRAEEVLDLEADVEQLIDASSVAATHANAARSSYSTLAAQKDSVEQHGACPYALLGCEQDTDEIRDHVLEGIEEKLLLARKEADTNNAAEVAARETSSLASERAARVRIEIRTADDLERRRADLERSLESKKTVLEELQERAGIHFEVEATARKDLEALGSDDALAKLYEEREALVDTHRALLSRVELIVRYSERLAALEREQGELEERTVRATALKELDGNLRRLRGHVIQALIEPLEKEAQEILHTMDPAKHFRFYFERGNAATLDLGFQEDGVIRLFDAASKGERVMITVAFLGALLAVIKPAMRLLVIDDLEQLDTERRARLMTGLVELGDRFDGVIVAGACALGGVPRWDVVDLAPDAATNNLKGITL